MKVHEKTILKVLERYGAEEIAIASLIESFISKQAHLWKYINDEIIPVLTKKEADYLVFLLLIIENATELSDVEIPVVEVSEFEEIEEANWEKFEGVKSKKFRARLDPFFEDSKEEDLLAFVEDMLTLEDEDQITSIGRDPIFIACASFIETVVI